MTRRPAADRAALLLNALGGDVVEPVIAQLANGRNDALRQKLQEFKQRPPSRRETEEVLAEFQRFIHFAADSTHGGESPRDRTAPLRIYRDGEGRDDQPEAQLDFELSDDPVADLNRLDAKRVAAALKHESPRTVAVVAGKLNSEQVSGILQLLPAEMRSQVFLHLKQNVSAPQPLIDRIAGSVLQAALGVDVKELKAAESNHDQKLAGVLRSMQRAERNQLLEALTQADADAALRIREFLYVFEDLLRVENRSLQKLLGDVDGRTLARALKGADQQIIDKVLKNLSQRAAAALTEEMELPAKADEIEEARKQVVETLAQRDRAGELVFEEE